MMSTSFSRRLLACSFVATIAAASIGIGVGSSAVDAATVPSAHSLANIGRGGVKPGISTRGGVKPGISTRGGVKPGISTWGGVKPGISTWG